MSLLTLAQVAAKCGVHRVTIYRWRKSASDFPRPLMLSAKELRFDELELTLWIASRRREAAQ